MAAPSCSLRVRSTVTRPEKWERILEVMRGGVAIVEADVTLTSCKIHQNWAKDGGGLQIENSNVTLTDCHIYENIAWGEGGGLEVTQSTETSFTAVKLTDCKIYDNEANHGGGMNIFNQRGALSASRLMPD